MRINRYEDLTPVVPQRSGFRSGNIEFRDLMVGREGTPENYGLQMVDVHEHYATPQHRHNFEQVRVMLDGSFGFGEGKVQHKGSVGYFCEGTHYTQAGEGRSTTLLLQIGGPSGQGFMSRAQLRGGIAALAARGEFAHGVYSWLDAQGKKHNQDSYEAVWEHVHGRPVAYPRPQYAGPVLLEPARFGYQGVAGNPGVSSRELGSFNGYGLRLSQLRLEAGAAYTPDTARQNLLLFCLDGSASAEAKDFGRWTSLDLPRGGAHTIKAHTTCEFFVFGLPRFDGAAHA